MVQLTVKITAALGRAHQLIDALHMLMRRAQQAKGCSGAHIAADLDEPDAFWYVEDWQDPRALEARLRSDDASQLLALMETSVKAPSLEFRMIEQSRGLDYVEAARSRGDESWPPSVS
jgi:quinol monooxygenase YgiN